MPRVTHNIAEANRYLDKANVKVIFTFRTPQLYDLWKNEMQGQISDGCWENSSKTSWLWENLYVQMGPVTSVETTNIYAVGRKSFGMNKDLWDAVGDRIIEENGFANEKEARAAWRELANAIYNVRATKEAFEISNKFKEEVRQKKESQKEAMKKEWEECGFDTSNANGCYWYASKHLNDFEWEPVPGEIRKNYTYIHIELSADGNGVLSHKVEYHENKHIVKAGQLREFLEALQAFDRKVLELKGYLLPQLPLLF